MAQSSDEIIKREIMREIGYKTGNIEIRIFPESSREDQLPFADGGLTFGYKGVPYGSCDAAWVIKNKEYIDGFNGDKTSDYPVIALEGTDALQRGSSGNAQLQRFHHALGAVKNGLIGIYYLKPGKHEVYPDLYGMAYFATKKEEGSYLIIQDLSIIKDILELINKYGINSTELEEYIDEYMDFMYKIWRKKKFDRLYDRDWNKFASRRSTIIKENENVVIKYAGRNIRNFTEGSQRAGHIAVGEMFLTRYYFYDKDFYYLFARMTEDELQYLDENKADDKEWFLLRNEPNVEIKTMDHLIGLPENVRDDLISVKSKPLKGDDLRTYNSCMKKIVELIKKDEIIID